MNWWSVRQSRASSSGFPPGCRSGCLGPGARRSEPEPARWVAGSNLGRGGGGCHRESVKVAEPSCPSHFGWRWMIKTKGGCTCTCTYSLFCVSSLLGEKPAMERETLEIWTPVWTWSHLRKVGRSAPHTPHCSPAHVHPVLLSLHLPACGGTHCIHLPVSGHRNTPIPPGIVTGTVFPNIQHCLMPRVNCCCSPHCWGAEGQQH